MLWTTHQDNISAHTVLYLFVMSMFIDDRSLSGFAAKP